MFSQPSIQRAGDPQVPGPAEVIHQQVAGHGRDPHLQAAAPQVKAGQVRVNLQKDILGQVFGVGRVAGKAVAKPIDTPMVGADQLGPRAGIPIHALADDPSPVLGTVDLQPGCLPARLAGNWRMVIARLYAAGDGWLLSAGCLSPAFPLPPQRFGRPSQPHSHPVPA